jgi:hypothetical protein
MNKEIKTNSSEITINLQTTDIFNNLIKYYNGCNVIKCNSGNDSNKINERIRRFYKAIKNDSKLKGYLLKRNKLIFYKNKDTEILQKINLYAYLKGEEREEVIEKIWDNITLLYLSIEETLEVKDENLFGNLTKSMEGGSLGKLFDNLHDEIENMDVTGMFEKLKANSTPESKSKASNLLTEMISKLTDNMGTINKSDNPGEALMSNLQNLAQDYSKMFESGEFDFASFLSAVPDLLNNPEEITKNIDMSKLEGMELPDLNKMFDMSKLNEMAAEAGKTENVDGAPENNSTNISERTTGLANLANLASQKGLGGAKGLEALTGLMSGKGGMEGLAGLMSGKGGMEGLAGLMGGMGGGKGGMEGLAGLAGGLSNLGGAGGIGESLNKMMGGKLDEIMASVIEKQGVSMLEKLNKDEEDKKNIKPLNEDQINELENYLKDKTLDMD